MAKNFKELTLEAKKEKFISNEDLSKRWKKNNDRVVDAYNDMYNLFMDVINSNNRDDRIAVRNKMFLLRDKMAKLSKQLDEKAKKLGK